MSVSARRSAILFPFETRGSVQELRPPELISFPNCSAPNPSSTDNNQPSKKTDGPESLCKNGRATKHIQPSGRVSSNQDRRATQKPTPHRNGPHSHVSSSRNGRAAQKPTPQSNGPHGHVSSTRNGWAIQKPTPSRNGRQATKHMPSSNRPYGCVSTTPRKTEPAHYRVSSSQQEMNNYCISHG
jgi:hypothetical protein